MDWSNLKQDVFFPVVARIKSRADSLRYVGRLFREQGNNVSAEGWLKLELAAALDEKVERVVNNGPDIFLASGDKVELKGATNLDRTYIRGGCEKYGVPCLFLGDGRSKQRIVGLAGDGIVLVAYEIFSDGSNEWVIGLIAPQ